RERLRAEVPLMRRHALSRRSRGPAHVLREARHPRPVIVPQVCDQYAAGEVVQPAAFWRPMIDARTLGDDRLRWRISAERFRLVSGDMIASRVRSQFLRMVQRLVHRKVNSTRERAILLFVPPLVLRRHGVHQPYTIRPAIESVTGRIPALPFLPPRPRMATALGDYPCPSKSTGSAIATAETAASRLRSSLSNPASKRVTITPSRAKSAAPRRWRWHSLSTRSSPAAARRPSRLT